MGAAEIAKLGEAELIPTPDKVICCGDPLELSLISSWAERELTPPGVKTTEMMQFAPAAIVLVQVFVSAKSVPFAPETTILLTTIPTLPEFVSVIILAGLAIPTN